MAIKDVPSNLGREQRIVINENFKDLDKRTINAERNSDTAKTKSEQAEKIANEAKAKADGVQKQFDEVVIKGDSSVEAAQARVSHTGTTYNSLRDRLDKEHQEVTSQLAQNTTDYLNLGKQNEGGTPDKDNTQLLLNLIDSAKITGKGLYVPNGQFYISDDVVIDGINNILIDGELIIANGKKLEIVGGRGEHSYNVNIRKVKGKLRLSGFFNSYIKIMGADELELYANGDLDYYRRAMAYNEITLGRIEKLRIFSEGTEQGWINENTFYGGRIFDLYIGGNYPHNHNIFYNPKIENGKIEIEHGSHNRLYDVRLEGENTIIFGGNAQSNRVYKSWNGNSPGRAFNINVGQDYTDNGTGNAVINTNQNDLKKETVYNLTIDRFNLDNFEKIGHELELTENYQTVFQSEIHEIDNDFGLFVESDKNLWRLQITLYDVNKSVIKDDLAISGSAFEHFEQGYYGNRFNLDKIFATITNNYSARYFSVHIQSGDNTNGERFKYMKLSLVTKKEEYIPSLLSDGKFKNRLTSNRKPEQTDFPRGTIVWHGAPLEGRDVGWIYDGNGNWLSMGKMTTE